jgi:hypothetical protein
MRKVLFVAVSLLIALSVLPPPTASAIPHRAGVIREEARLFSQIVPMDPDAAGGGVGPGQQNQRQVNCGPFGDGGRGVFDKDISCDDETISPDNEMAIAVHPSNPDLLLAGSNDYQITFLGNTSNLQVPSGFFFSGDGGATWIDGELPLKGSLGGGDPAPAFDVKHNQMVFASLSFVCGQFAPVCSRGNIMFASSPLGPNGTAPSGQINWSDRVVANGSASDNGAQQIFLDKEWIAVDNYRLLPNGQPNPNYGNIYIVYQAFRTEKGVYDESPVMFVKSEDGGNNWTLPVEISGRNPVYCTFQDDANDTADTNGPNSTQGNAEGPDDPFACDQNSFSIPTVAPDGTLYVQWDNEQNAAGYEPPQRYDSQVQLIKSSDGGDTFVGEQPTSANQQGCVRIEAMAFGPNSSCIVPRHVVNKEDSYDFFSEGANGTAVPDYPINVDGRTTMTGHQFRVNSAGNLAVGPNAASPVGYRLWSVFADNLHGVRPGNGLPSEDPPGEPAVTPVTNTDVFYAYSDDGGATWVGGDEANSNPATRLQANPPDTAADQWFPWSDTNKTTGALVVGYMDANVDGPVRNQYGFTNVTVPVAGLPGPALVVSSQNSNPNNSLFFAAGAPDCQFCATFIGDYNGLAVDSTGKVHSVWTDMRRNAAAPFPARAVEDAFYARVPAPQ